MTLTVTLPWPDRRLSPNARAHWGGKAQATKQARTMARYAMFEQGVDLWAFIRNLSDIPALPIPITWTFHSPTWRTYDRDNCIASCKAYQDGLADALGINDSRFEPTYKMGDVAPGGQVVVVIGD